MEANSSDFDYLNDEAESSLLRARVMMRERRKLESQITALEATLADIRSKEEDHLERRFDAASRPLCEMMQERLPRELRDIVYGYLTTLGDVSVSSNHINYERYSLPPSKKVTLSPSIEGERNYRLPEPPYTNRYYRRYTQKRLGHKTLVELVENYYRINKFTLEFREQIVESFLTSSRFEPSVAPSKVVSQIYLKVHSDCVDKRSVNFKDIKAEVALQGLFSLRSGANLHFQIWTRFEDEGDQMTRLFGTIMTFREILPTLLKLKLAGYNVSVGVDYSRVLCNGSDLTMKALVDALRKQQKR
ncbi:hypothetical protein K491DRAFT_784731 [Lophiostoma macrostomum CBS 122681]|uniref:Uncharacterized protein n=1 Tax=Lophiostoma macrostomum CBS 122681 TaxID=1314788 RepID=A0A6A6SI45_9PLEO|nr:hypothetical protein K491DRAFT_784731 [Lophiostoma macrostomum CBS 122681]